MSDIFAARPQNALSLALHIIFAAIGVALPLMMVLAETTKALLEHRFPRLYHRINHGEKYKKRARKETDHQGKRPGPRSQKAFTETPSLTNTRLEEIVPTDLIGSQRIGLRQCYPIQAEYTQYISEYVAHE
jgi:hypothetical protein